MNELIQQLALAIARMGPTHDVELVGRWSTSKRKTYGDASQLGSGAGPFIDVVDVRWRATLKCAVPLVGLSFMDTPAQTLWVKSVAPEVNPTAEISMHAYAGYLPGCASLAGSLFGEVSASVPVNIGENPIDSCSLGTLHTTTATAHYVAEVDGTNFIMLVIPRTFVKIGRK